MTSPRILVVGDLMLDRYSWGRVTRVSPEAPVPILELDEVEDRLGGAGAVASIAAGLGADVDIVGAVGADSAGRKIKRLLGQDGIHTDHVVVSDFLTTTVKHRFIGAADGLRYAQLLRVDKDDEASPRTCSGRTAKLPLRGVDMVLVSDYGKGVCNQDLLDYYIEKSHKYHKYIIVDPCCAKAQTAYDSAKCICPNRREAEAFCGYSIHTSNDAEEACRMYCDRLHIKDVMLKLDRSGIYIFHAEGGVPTVSELLKTTSQSVCDVTGAGDTVLATAGYFMSLGHSFHDSAVLANCAAGLQVENFGIRQISREDIISSKEKA